MAKKRTRRSKAPPEPSHDPLFREAYSYREHAVAHLSTVLAPEQLALLDLDNAVLLAGSFVESDLRSALSDVIWQCPLKNTEAQAKITFLFEHKSSPPNQPIEIQLLQYILGIWRRELADGQPPSIVVAVVVAHGVKSWTPPQMRALFPGVSDIFLQFLPEVKFIFTHLNDLPDEIIKANEALGTLRSIWLALKYAFDAQGLKQNFADIAIFAVSQRLGAAREMLLEMLFVYVQKRLNMGTKEMENLIETLPKEPRATVRSTYDKIIEKGRREGRREGREEGREEGRKEGREEGRREGREEGIQIGMERLLRNLIRNTEMGDEEIARMTDVEVAYVAALRKRIHEE